MWVQGVELSLEIIERLLEQSSVAVVASRFEIAQGLCFGKQQRRSAFGGSALGGADCFTILRPVPFRRCRLLIFDGLAFPPSRHPAILQRRARCLRREPHVHGRDAASSHVRLSRAPLS